MRVSLAAIVTLFALAQIASAQFTVVTPNGGEQFHRFDSVRVSWRGNDDGAPVRVAVVDANDSVDVLLYQTSASSASFPAHRLPAGPYRIRLTTLRQDTSAIAFKFGYPYGHLAISPDGRELAYPHADGVVRLRDMYTGNSLREIRVANAYETRYSLVYGSVKYSKDGSRLLVNYPHVNGRPLSIVVDPRRGTVIWRDTTMRASDISSDGRAIAVGNVIRDVATLDTIIVLGDSVDAPGSVLLSPDMQYAASNTSAIVKLWSVRTGKLVYTWYPHYASQIYGMRFNPDGRSVAVIDENSALHAWSLATGAYIMYMGIKPPLSFAFSRDGKRFVMGSMADGLVRIYDFRTGKKLREWPASSDALVSVDFSSDDERVVTNDVNGRVRIFHFEESMASDDSDSTWSALTSRIALDLRGDFGRIVVPSTRDSVHTATITHVEPQSPQWTLMKIEGPDAGSFEIRGRYTFPLMLQSGHRLMITFKARREGAHVASFVLAFGRDTLRLPLTGVGVRQQVQRSAEGIDFGLVFAGGRKDTVIAAMLRNVDSLPRSVKVSLVDDGEFSEFAIVEGGGVFVMEPYAVRHVHMRYTASPRTTQSKGKVLVTYAGDGSPYYIALAGRSTGAPSSAATQDAGAAIELVARTSHSLRVRLPHGTHELMLVSSLGEMHSVASYDGDRIVDVDLTVLPRGYHLLVVKGPSGRRSWPVVGMR